jgi:hypothetical protein
MNCETNTTLSRNIGPDCDLYNHSTGSNEQTSLVVNFARYLITQLFNFSYSSSLNRHKSLYFYIIEPRKNVGDISEGTLQSHSLLRMFHMKMQFSSLEKPAPL